MLSFTPVGLLVEKEKEKENISGVNEYDDENFKEKKTSILHCNPFYFYVSISAHILFITNNLGNCAFSRLSSLC